MERPGAVLSKNIALALKAELSAEKQRLEQGRITVFRRPLIEKIYSSIRKKGRL